MIGLERATTITFPQGDTAKYIINRNELDSLVERKLLRRGDKLYTYFALMLDYPNGAEGMIISTFCERWGISEADAAVAIAALQKKAVLKQKSEQLSFEFTYPDD